MKIFYKSISDPKEVLEKNSFSHEQLLFPDHVFKALKDALEESTDLLPAEAKKFQDWSVGLLERFDEGDFQGDERSVGITPEVELNDSGDNRKNERRGDVDIKDIPNSEALLE
jgi:hypothetical protein